MNVSINRVTGDALDRKLNSHTGIATLPRGDKKCEGWKRSKTRMLFDTNSVQLMQRIPCQGSFGKVGILKNRWANHSHCEYADDLVLLAKEEKVLQGMIDKLIEIGRCCGMEMSVEKKRK
jgi:hypothetical protein